jgi:tetratricopeptide (TPR) repeat protein
VARQFSVLSLSYASAYSTGTIDFVRVHKPDGSTVTTPTEDAMEMPAEVSREAPMYSDVKEKHLPVRSLAAGDRLEYQFHTTITKAQAPGQFWGAEHFTVSGGVVLNQTVTLQVPEKTYVQVWSPNHPVTPVTRDGLKTWTWTSSQSKASARDENGRMTAADVKDPDEDNDGRKPSVAWTTFHSWAEVGDWYRGLAAQRLQPTATVRAKAEDLTKDAKTPEEQAQALYRFVATQIRYISISFGVGRFQPHTPDEVLDHGYGDCKDKDTLLESLLRAKGLTTAPVLIGAGVAPVSDVPSPAVFNHVITTVELPGADGKSQRIWLDSTAEVAPFRVLMPVIRDQQALVIPDKEPAALMKTPENPPFSYSERFESAGTLDAKGVLKAHVQMTVRSDSEMAFRTLLQRLSPSQWDEAIGYVSSGMNFGGKVSNADLKQSDASAPVHIGFDYIREDYANWKTNHIWPMLPSLEITYISKEKAPEHDIDLGVPRKLEAESIIAVPAGDRMELPSARHVSRSYTTYDETYRFVDGKFIANRVVVIKQHKLNKSEWKDYLAFVKEAGLEDSMQEATLIPPATPVTETVKADTATAKAPEDSDEATAKELQDAVIARETKGDWTAARAYAEKAMKRFPDAAYSHSVLAYVDAHDKHYDEAIRGYKAELAAHPDDQSSIVQLLAGVYMGQKRYDDAIATLRQYSSRNDQNLRQQLVAALSLKGDTEGALAATREALAESPNDKAIQTQVARLLKELHRDDEAALAAEKALENNDNPNSLNSNAYYLAEMKKNLPLAESSSRRSVAMFERLTSAGAAEEANTRAFGLSAQMVAAWDTLGDILRIAGKAKAAETYLAPAWFNWPDPTKGNHLAQAYEDDGRKEDARRIDAMVLSMNGSSNYKEDWDAVKDREERLSKVKKNADDGASLLLKMRTYHLKRLGGVAGSGIVRVQLSGVGILDAAIVSGDMAALKPLLAQLKDLKIPPAVPPASEAHVLRDAVLFCGKTAPTCDFVFMERSGIAVEGLDK